ncbi:MAG: hypothetical protein J6T35_07835 [Bacteroidales bacterium]|nr:hypothetical protein [Bacteroidales bacterium]
METWKEIAEFPDYKVSNLGRVQTKKGLILHTYPSQRGHRVVRLCVCRNTS